MASTIKTKRMVSYNGVYVCVLIAICFTIIVPILIYSACSLPVADDYSQAKMNFPEAEGYSNLLIPAMRYTVRRYMTSGGSYIGFFSMILSPFKRWDLAGIRGTNTIVNLAFYFFLFFYIHVFCVKWIGKDTKFSIVMYTAFVFCLNNIGEKNSEIYTRLINVESYVLGLLLLCIVHGYLIKSIADNSKAYIISAVVGFLLGGDALNVVTLNCGLLIILIYLSYVKFNKLMEPLIVFFCSLAGGIINVMAPGNYARHDTVSSGYNIVGSVIKSAIYSFEQLENKMTETIFPVVLVFVIVLIFLNRGWEDLLPKFRHPLLVALLFYCGIVIINFPVIFGAGIVYDRGRFIQDFGTYVLLFLWILYFCGWLSTKFDLDFSRIKNDIGYVVALAVSCFVLIQSVDSFEEMTTPYMIKSIINGNLAQYVSFEEGIIEEVKNSEDSKVTIYRDTELENPFFDNIGRDRSKYSNSAFGGYYGKEVTIQYADEKIDLQNM